MEPISSSPLPSFVRDDLALAAQLGGRNPKNYQIWYHRRAMLQPILQTTATATTATTTTSPDAMSLETPTSSSSSSAIAMAVARLELDYIATVLEEDAKNYHAWSHRQFILKETLAHWDSTATAPDDNNVKDDIVLLWKEELEYGKQGRRTNEGTMTLSHTDRLTTFPASFCLSLFSTIIQSIN